MSPVPFRLSWRRIVAYSFRWGVPVLALIAIIMLPRFIKLDTYRPEIQEQLRQASGRRVVLGDIQAHLLPPSILAERIVVLEQIPPYRPILSAERVRLRLRLWPLLHGAIQIHTAVIEQPRLILYTDRLLYVPADKPSPSGTPRRPSLRVLIHDGRIELGGSLYGQKIRWSIDHVEAKVEGAERRIELSAKPSFLGPTARLHATFSPGADRPVLAELMKADLDPVLSVFGSTQAAVLRGLILDAHAEAQWPIMKRIDLHIDRMTVPAIPGAIVQGALQISNTSVRGKINFEGLTSSMTLTGQLIARGKKWKSTLRLEHYSPEITHLLWSNRWIDALEGPGSVQISMSRQGSGPCQISIAGSGYTFSGTRFEIPYWTYVANGAQYDVHVEAETPDRQGHVKVHWGKISSQSSGQVEVAMSSITVGDVFDVFALHPSTPVGIESWTIREGHYQGTAHPNSRIEFSQAAFTFDHLGLETTGSLDISTTPATVRIEGQAVQVDLSTVLESLGAHPAPVVGAAQTAFQLQFSAEARRLDTLNGRIDIHSEDGFIRAGKLFYKVAGYLNLKNLLKPSQRSKDAEAGIPYQSASGIITLTNGVLKTQQLKILTKNMNIFAKGEIDLPRRTIDARLELQLMGFLKDGLRSIPVVKRAFTPDTGMLQIPLRLHGKLDNPDID